MRITTTLPPSGTPLFVHQKYRQLEKTLYTRLFLVSALMSALLFCSVSIHAQDLHYTQFQNAPFGISPGLAGVFKEDVRVVMNYRRQWAKVVDYETYGVGADLKLWPYRPNSTGFFSVGISANRDQAGLSKLTLLNLGLHTSYTQKLSNKAFLTFGLRGAFNQRKFDLGDLVFPVNYACPECPPPNGLNTTKSFFSLGAGFNLRLQALNERDLVDDLTHRSKLDLGFGLFNLNRPNSNFVETNPERLPIGVTPYALSVIQLGKRSDLALNAIAQVQKKSYEFVAMAGFKYHLSQFVDHRTAIQPGFGLRFSDNESLEIDAVAWYVQFFINEWQFGISCDINISDFKVATDGQGGPEFFVRYGFTKVKLPQPWRCRIL